MDTTLDNESGFPVLRGRVITNTGELTDALMTASADLAAGRITVKEGRAINREARGILKIIRAAVSAHSLAYRASA
jgi:hypothetical protein